MKNRKGLFLYFIIVLFFTMIFAPSFLFAAVPSITGVNPNTGSSATTTNVAITGANFEYGAKVSLLNGGSFSGGSYDTPDYAEGIMVSGNYAYVADGDSGLQIINISNPESPTFVSSYNTPGHATDVYISGNYAYVADGYSGLQIINISNPASPILTGSFTQGRAMGVFVSGNYAYVTIGGSGSNGLQIIDVTNPSTPTLIGSYQTIYDAHGVFVSGNYAYVANSYSGLIIIDISNPASPTLTGSYDTPGSWWALLHHVSEILL